MRATVRANAERHNNTSFQNYAPVNVFYRRMGLREPRWRQRVEISTVVNQKLPEYFSRYPRRLYELKPRQFEELVAEIWDAFGFEVELTQQTRDGGKDILAIRKTPERLMYSMYLGTHPTHSPTPN